jgi:hypothetical protein
MNVITARAWATIGEESINRPHGVHDNRIASVGH